MLKSENWAPSDSFVDALKSSELMLRRGFLNLVDLKIFNMLHF